MNDVLRELGLVAVIQLVVHAGESYPRGRVFVVSPDRENPDQPDEHELARRVKEWEAWQK